MELWMLYWSCVVQIHGQQDDDIIYFQYRVFGSVID